MRKLKKVIAALRVGKHANMRLDRKRIARLRLDDDFVQLIQDSALVDRFSEKLYTTYKATEYLLKSDIRGDFVECGVYRGRHVSMMAMTLLKHELTDREIYLYDTFAGMTKPGPHDARSGHDHKQKDLVEKWESQDRGTCNLISYAPLEMVQRTVNASGYPTDRFHFIEGDIRETVPNTLHDRIALLRLDTDWYELTRHELTHMYDLLVPGGVLIIDDYGSHEGARKAVDEFFAERGIFPFLFRTTKSERAMLKPPA